MRLLRRLLPVVVLQICLCWTVLAADIAADVANFAKNSYVTTAQSVTALAKSADPHAVAILQALNEGRLLYDEGTSAVYIKQADQSLILAASGAVAAVDQSKLKPVRLNNQVRRTLEAAMGDLTLMQGEPALRIEAATKLLRAHNSENLPTITNALAQEKNPDVKTALNEARAAIIALDDQASVNDRLLAVETLKNRGDSDALSVLSMMQPRAEGLLKSAVQVAIAAIEGHQKLLDQVQNLLYGLSLGSILLLAAIGLAITFGVMGIINMAHGEMVMIGAYATFGVQQTLLRSAPNWMQGSLLIAIPVAFVVAGVIGMVIERTIIRFFYGRPLETLLATFGVSLILQQGVRSLFGADNRPVIAPDFMSGSLHLAGLALPYNRLWIILFSLLIFAALQFVLHLTPFGLRMRAVTQIRRMAASMGISTQKVDMLSFGLGSGIAGMAGVAISQIDNVSPNLGQSYIMDSFLVVVFGGVGNPWGTLLAAFILGVAGKFLEPLIGAVLGKILLLVFVIVFIQKRPRGLFALKGRAVED